MVADSLPAGSRRIIYDLGANNGDDLPYYLRKSDLVVAVEANPTLTRVIEERFAPEISAGRLVVENCVLVDRDGPSRVPFFIHRTDDVRSQFPPPSEDEVAEFDRVLLPAQSIMSLVSTHGLPYYIKIDIEHYDEVILRQLFSNGIRPVFISAESHTIEVFSLLHGLGQYTSFNLVDGASVAQRYGNHVIQTDRGPESYSFPYHSAGPFGEDIATPWMTANNFIRLLALEGLGWKDVHATSAIPPDPSITAPVLPFLLRAIRQRLGQMLRRA